MRYLRFLGFSVAGGLGWVLLCTFGGYFFGNLPVVRDNFSLAILAIIFVSLLPGFFELFAAWRRRRLTTS